MTLPPRSGGRGDRETLPPLCGGRCHGVTEGGSPLRNGRPPSAFGISPREAGGEGIRLVQRIPSTPREGAA